MAWQLLVLAECLCSFERTSLQRGKGLVGQTAVGFSATDLSATGCCKFCTVFMANTSTRDRNSMKSSPLPSTVKGSKPGGTVVVGGGGTVVVSVGAWFIYRNVPRILRTEFPNYGNPSRT